MNLSKQTIERVANAISAATYRGTSQDERLVNQAQAAITAMLQSEEMRELLESVNLFFNVPTEFLSGTNYANDMKKLDEFETRVRKALAPFLPEKIK